MFRFLPAPCVPEAGASRVPQSVLYPSYVSEPALAVSPLPPLRSRAPFGNLPCTLPTFPYLIPDSALNPPAFPYLVPDSALNPPTFPYLVPHSALNPPTFPYLVPHSVLLFSRKNCIQGSGGNWDPDPDL